MSERIEQLKSQLEAQCVVVRHCEDALRDAEKRRNATAAELLWHRNGVGVGAVVRDPRGVTYKVAWLKPWDNGETAEMYGSKAKADGGWGARAQFIGYNVEVIEPAPEPQS